MKILLLCFYLIAGSVYAANHKPLLPRSGVNPFLMNQIANLGPHVAHPCNGHYNLGIPPISLNTIELAATVKVLSKLMSQAEKQTILVNLNHIEPSISVSTVRGPVQTPYVFIPYMIAIQLSPKARYQIEKIAKYLHGADVSLILKAFDQAKLDGWER